LLCRRYGIVGIEGRALLGAALATAIMASALQAVRVLALPLLPLAVVGAAGLYLSICVWLGAIRRTEVQHAWEMFAGLLAPLRRFSAAPGLSGRRPTPSSQWGQT
jgi:hypothetical protein